MRLLAEGPDVQRCPGRARRDGRRLHRRRRPCAPSPSGCDVITFDHEHVPTGLLRELEAAGVAVRPGPDALVHAQDKVVMRDRLSARSASPARRTGWSPTRDACVAFGDETRLAGDRQDLARRLRRQGRVADRRSPREADEPFAARGGLSAGSEILAEEYVDFARELSALVVRVTVRAGRGLPGLGVGAARRDLRRDDDAGTRADRGAGGRGRAARAGGRRASSAWSACWPSS